MAHRKRVLPEVALKIAIEKKIPIRRAIFQARWRGLD